jgi:heme-degrading monooxygenase HmoA
VFARYVALRLRPNSLNEFERILDSQVIPLLHKQPGFKDLITLALVGGTDVTAISLWETREHAQAYHTATYAQVDEKLRAITGWEPQAAYRRHRKFHISRACG